MKPRNLNQQFKLESLKVESSKVIVQEQSFQIQHSTFKINNRTAYYL